MRIIDHLINFGIINIDKPSGPTSFWVDTYVRKALGLTKVSHAGTLDPKVTGVLPIALNRACKLTGFFLGENKTYVGIMRLHENVSIDKLKEAIEEKFLGKIKQIPPKKSRVKRQEREREIVKFEILEEHGKDFLFISEVQGGTYIRKLIDDLGKELGVGAHMLELRRIKAGIFNEEDKIYPCVNLYDFGKAVEEYKKGDGENLRKIIIPGEIVSEIHPVVEIKNLRLKEIFTGKPILESDLKKKVGFEMGEKICIFSENLFVGVYKTTNDKNIFAKAEFVMQPIKK